MRTTSLCVGLIGVVASLSGCAPDSSPWGGAGGGAEPGRDPEAVLRARFPVHAGEILDREESFVAADREIVVGAPLESGGFRRVIARLPADDSGVVTMEVTGGFSIRVREIGIAGGARPAGGAIAYERAGGTSYWAGGEHGPEEWLSLDAGVVREGEPVAAWEIEGATLAEDGARVHLLDEHGFAQMTVSSPRAYTAGGRDIDARLVVAGMRIELFADGAGEAVLIDPAWTAVAAMSTGRYFHTLVYIPSTGKALASAGIDHNGVWIKTAELFNPATGTWSAAASMANEHGGGTATLLSNGKVLVAGGSGVGSSTAEVYDPSSNTWSAAGSASFGYHTATVLTDNRVLVAQGSAQIYSPATNTWSSAAAMSSSRLEAVGALLTVGPNAGKVLVAGGYVYPSTFATAEMYDPATNTWSAVPSMNSARHCHVATVLSDGRVLVTGGSVISGNDLDSAEIYNPSTNSWAFVAPMGIARCHHQAIRLQNNKVLVTGAAGSGNAQIYDPATNTWTAVSPMNNARVHHEAVLLGNGDVLLAGGSNTYNSPALFSAETFRQQPAGQSCGAPGDCSSGYCVDGKCCNTACTGTCVACSAAKKGSGSDGVCGNIGAALDPDGECAAQVQATCGTTGVCSGGGACQLYASGAVCVAASCNGSLATKADLCNGTGSCVDGGTQQCAPFGCSAGVCYASCSNDAQCASGNYCAAPSCLAQKALGAPCAAANQCQSGFCVDAVCCSSACGASCMACSSSKTGSPDGTCTFVSAGQDPDGECPDQGAASCGQNGFCNGSGSCGLYASGTICAAASCAGTVFQAVDLCNGSGNCVNGGSVDCEPYVCGPAGCAATCVGDIHCAADAYCAAPACVLKKPTGSACAGANQCQSAHCADGVCCDAACDGLCEACSAAKKGSGANGACGPVAPGADPDLECADAGVASCGDNGACDGSGACQKYALGEVCDPGSCDGTTWGGVAHCDGAGTCVTPLAEECWPFACGMAGCWEACSTDEQCAPDAFCIAPGCHAKKAIGSPCASGNQCSSGSCADGVCCDNECDGPCEACVASKKGEGQDGLCGPAPAGIDPDNDCPKTGPTVCGNDGECDGAGACRKYAAGVECFAANCDPEKAQFTPPGECDGQSACIHGITQDCAPYSCDETGCLPACSSDAECASAAYCDAPSCVDKKPAGDPCDGDAQCAGGVCENGVCCEVDCGGTGTGGTGGTGATGGASDEESKSFYACSAVSSGPGTMPIREVLALASSLWLAVRRRRRPAPRLPS